jgi:CheY-like chemotaxis protein
MPTRVIVAHESDAIRDAALRVVRGLGFEGVGVADGDSVRALVFAPPAPAALVLDVGLPAVAAYQLVDEVRGRDVPVAVVLVASVYSRTAYKRRPTSLHGADDYVEQHHVPDQLGPKLERLLGRRTPPHGVAAAGTAAGAAAGTLAGDHAVADAIRRAGEGRLAFRYTTRDEAVARARQLAEVVVADLLLYAAAEADSAPDRAALEALLGRDLNACRELLALRIPAEVAGIEDYVGHALDRYLAARRREASRQ